MSVREQKHRHKQKGNKNNNHTSAVTREEKSKAKKETADEQDGVVNEDAKDIKDAKERELKRRQKEEKERYDKEIIRVVRGYREPRPQRTEQEVKRRLLREFPPPCPAPCLFMWPVSCNIGYQRNGGIQVLPEDHNDDDAQAQRCDRCSSQERRVQRFCYVCMTMYCERCSQERCVRCAELLLC